MANAFSGFAKKFKSGGGGMFQSFDDEWEQERKQSRLLSKAKKYDRYALQAANSPALPNLLQEFKKKAKEGDEDARIRYNAIQAVRGRKPLEAKTKVEKVILESYKPKNSKERQERRKAADQVFNSTQVNYEAPDLVRKKGLGAISEVTDDMNKEFLGGILRQYGNLIEKGDKFIPGKQEGAGKLFAETFPEAREGSLGKKAGQVQKAGLDLGITLATAGKAESLIRGTSLIKALSQGGRGARLAGRAITEVGGGVPASLSYALAQEGTDKKVDYGKEVATGAAIDLMASVAGPILGSALRGAKGVKQGFKARRLDKQIKTLQDIGRTGDSTEDLVQGLIKTADDTKNKYKKNVIQKFFQRTKETFNPTTEFRKIDQMKERLVTKKGGQFNRGSDSLEAAYDNVNSSNVRADGLLTEKNSTGESVVEVFQKHADDEAEFNVYRNAVADKLARKRKVKFQRDLSEDQLDDIIEAYEASHPTARQDIKTINEAVNKARRVANKAGALSDELDSKLGNSPDYTPVGTVTPEDTPRIKIGGRSATTGQQGFVKEATGADAKLDTSFEPIINYIRGAHKNAAQARLSQLLLEAHENGLIKGSKIISEPGAKAAKTDLKGYAKGVKKTAEKLERKLKFTKKEARTLSREIRAIQKEARSTVEKGIKKTLQGQLVPTERPIGENIKGVIEDVLRADKSTLNRLNKKFLNREPKLAAKLEEIISAQDEISALKSEARGARQAAMEITDDPTTGLSTIRGMDENGKAYTLEVPPEVTKLLKGTDVVPKSRIIKALLTVQRTFQTAWTGFANPIFNFVVNPLYDVSANVNMLVDNPKAFIKSFTPDAFKKTLKGFVSSDSFQKALRSEGAVTQGGSLMPQNVSRSVNSLISKKDLKSRTGYLLKNPKEVLDILDQFSGKLGNATRTRIAAGYYKEALSRNLSEVEALKEAAFAFNNIAPNFNRVNEFARNANAFIPYFTAGISGNRSMWQPILKNPGRAAAVYGGIVSTFIGATALNLSSDAGQKFYKEMLDSDNRYVLDGNLIIVLPTATRNDKTGEWSGIIKIPISPEYRYINQLAHQSTQKAITGESKMSPTSVAGAILNTMTGGVPDSVAQGPTAVRMAQVLAGGKARGNILSPEPLVKGQMSSLPKGEQVYDWTSNPAKFFSEITGRTISPIQADEIINQFGTAGRLAKGTSFSDVLKGRFEGAYTESLPTKAYENTAGDYINLSDTMKKKKVGVEGARKIAENHNRKVDRYIKMIEKSNMSKADKKKEVDKLKKRKASTEDYALEKRLGL